MKSSIEAQELDCNCNDCVFMERNMELFKEALERHKKWQFDYFTTIKNNLIEKANDWKRRGFIEKHDALVFESSRMRFQFDKKVVSINYGKCLKFDKPVTFIPNVCQLDTQECFKHRRR